MASVSEMLGRYSHPRKSWTDISDYQVKDARTGRLLVCPWIVSRNHWEYSQWLDERASNAPRDFFGNPVKRKLL